MPCGKRKRKTAIVSIQWQFLSNFVDFNHFSRALQVNGCDCIGAAADGDGEHTAPVVGDQAAAGEIAGHPQRGCDGAAAGAAGQSVILHTPLKVSTRTSFSPTG